MNFVARASRKVTKAKNAGINVLHIHLHLGSMDGAVVRALASHHCGPGSIPGLGVICWLSLLLVLILAPRVFLRVLRFFLRFRVRKTNISKFQFDQKFVEGHLN